MSKKKKVDIPYEELFIRFNKAVEDYRGAKNPDTLKCLKDVARLIVANTVNPTTPPPPPPSPAKP